MSLTVLSEFLDHEDPETTLIYAYADIEMKRQAVGKASEGLPIPNIEAELPTGEDADIISRLVRGY